MAATGGLHLEVDLHMHSLHSRDSRSRPEWIVARAVSLGLGAIAVTDHNSWAGARDAKRIAAGGILIIPGAEIRTNKGDVLALFVNDDIATRDFTRVIDSIRDAGGVSIIPHPADSRQLTVEDIRLADGLEAFNSTCTPRSNSRASSIAAGLGKPGVGSSDAHLVMEVGNGRTMVQDCESLEELREVLLKNPMISMRKTSNLLLHAGNAVVNYGLKGIWRR